MTRDEIQGLLNKAVKNNDLSFRFSLKKRNDIFGSIVNGRDYQNLNKKNYWYVLTDDKKVEYSNTRNMDLLLLFPGDAFSKILSL